MAYMPLIFLDITLPANDFSGKLQRYSYNLIDYGTISLGLRIKLNSKSSLGFILPFERSILMLSA